MTDTATLKKVWTIQTEILDEIVKICQHHGLAYYLIYGSLIGAVRHGGFIPWDDDLDIMMPRKDYQIFLKAAQEELPAAYFLQCDETEEDYWLNFAKVRKNNTLFEEPSAKFMGEKTHKGIFVDIFPFEAVKDPDSGSLHLRAIFAKAINETRYLKKGMLGSDSMNYKALDGVLKYLSHRTLAKWYRWLVMRKDTENCKYYLDLFTSRSYRDSLYPVSYFDDGIQMKFMDREYTIPVQYDALLTKEYGNYREIPSPEERVNHNTTRILFDVQNER